MRPSSLLVAALLAATPAIAQTTVSLPTGHNLRDRAEQPGDVVLDVGNAGTYAVNGAPVSATQLPRVLMNLLSRTRDHVVYVRADAQLPAAAIDSATALVARGSACVASFVGTQQPGTRSFVSGDAGPEAGDVRRAIDVQLPVPHPAQATLARQAASAIVLEVLPGPAYRINTHDVAADNLTVALQQIFHPRPLKILYVRADPSASYQDVFRAMDAARYAGIIDIVAAPPAMTIRATRPTIDLTIRITQRDDAAAERIAGNVGRCRRGDVYAAPSAGSGGAAASEERVFFEFQVEQRASLLPGSYVLRYPDMLREGKISGEVLAQFVVDTNGVALPETFKVLKSTHDLFTQSVKDALGDMRFSPAAIAGKHVKQLVQQSFVFTYAPSTEVGADVRRDAAAIRNQPYQSSHVASPRRPRSPLRAPWRSRASRTRTPHTRPRTSARPPASRSRRATRPSRTARTGAARQARPTPRNA